MNNRVKIAGVLVALLCSLVMVGVSGAASSTQYGLEWTVHSAGGAPMSSSTYGLDSTVAQPVTGTSTSSTYTLCTGYWCGIPAEYTNYLPIIMVEY